MPSTYAPWMVAAAILFAIFLLVKARLPLGSDPRRVEGRRKLAEARVRAREAGKDRVRRAKALRDAAHVALADLAMPNLAASYARRALKIDPHDTESVDVVAAAMVRAKRYRALEKLLWRKLDEEGFDPHVFERLIDVYDGPMRRPEQARVMRKVLERCTNALSTEEASPPRHG